MVTTMANEIIGRGEEVERLGAYLDSRDVDGPRALVLAGEAGIGKTTLWLRGVELARERGLRVLSTRPAEAERNFALAGLGDLFEGALDEVLPALAQPRRRALKVALLLDETEDPLAPRAVAVAVRNALELLAEAQPLLVAVDDDSGSTRPRPQRSPSPCGARPRRCTSCSPGAQGPPARRASSRPSPYRRSSVCRSGR